MSEIIKFSKPDPGEGEKPKPKFNNPLEQIREPGEYAADLKRRLEEVNSQIALCAGEFKSLQEQFKQLGSIKQRQVPGKVALEEQIEAKIQEMTKLADEQKVLMEKLAALKSK